MKWSILDRSPARQGSGEDAAIRDSLALARLCDRLDYHRYWLSEHHDSASLAPPDEAAAYPYEPADRALIEALRARALVGTAGPLSHCGLLATNGVFRLVSNLG